MKSDETISNSIANMHRIFDVQRDAQIQAPFPSIELRKDRINRLIDTLVRHEDPLIEAVMADFENRSPMLTRVTDIMPTLDNLKYVRKNIKKWMKHEKRKSKFPLGLLGGKSKVEHIPMGVVGNISPWNFPIQLALSPIADIFGAGNRVMLKPSELSSHTSEVMANMIASNFDESELAVVLGGPELSSEFSKLKFDHLLFTGSTSIAKFVAQEASKNLVPMTLELGGKNPVIISTTAEIKLAAEKIMWAKAMNGGQICLCPDTIYIPGNLTEEFISACKAALKKMYPHAEKDSEYTHIITQRHADRLNDMLNEAKQSGARVIPLVDSPTSGRRVLPSLILNADDKCKISQEEVFGPLLTIKNYASLPSVITEINQNPRPLALYYFGKDKQEIEKLTYETTSGGMVVNEMLAHIMQEDLPFGGVGDSGTGSYHGNDGFKNFSHAKAVFTQSNFDLFSILRPPYGTKFSNAIKKQIKR